MGRTFPLRIPSRSGAPRRIWRDLSGAAPRRPIEQSSIKCSRVSAAFRRVRVMMSSAIDPESGASTAATVRYLDLPCTPPEQAQAGGLSRF